MIFLEPDIFANEFGELWPVGGAGGSRIAVTSLRECS
jgi:hypothetical protein